MYRDDFQVVLQKQYNMYAPNTNFGNDAEYVFDFDRERLLLGNPVNSILITVRGAVRD